MATYGIRDPRIAQGFSSLANAFLPKRVDPAQQAQLEYHAQRAELTRAQAQAERFKLQSATEIDSLFSMPAENRDERWRGRLAAAMSGMDGGLQHGPGFLTGATTFMDPQGLNESDLSNVLVGTGVVNSFAQTPEGQRRTLEGNLDVQRVRNENPGAGRQPRVVSPTILRHLTKSATERLAEAYEVDPGRLALDPEFNDMLQSLLASKYAQSGDASMAELETLDELTATIERTDNSWNPLTSRAFRVSPGADAIPGFAGGGGGGPLPEDGGATEDIGSPEGTIIENDAGEQLVRRGGQWVPLDG